MDAEQALPKQPVGQQQDGQVHLREIINGHLHQPAGVFLQD